MDLWYFFLHQAFNIADKEAYISYITNSYWVKSDGSKKLINRIFDEKTLNEIIYFDDYPIFEEVSGKHMIHSYYNSQPNNEYKVKLVLVDNKEFDKDINKETVKFYSNKEIVETDSINLNVSSNKLFKNCIHLGELYNASVGIQESSDKVASKNIPTSLINKFKGGEGVFVINKDEVENLDLNKEEQELLKPYLNSNNVVKYGVDFSDEYLIFSDKKNREEIKENKYPNIKKHLDNTKHFITSSNAPYGLHRDRSSKVNPFDIPKLLCPGMFKSPHFTYDDKKHYVGFSFSVIWQKNKEYDLKYLLGIMNSKLGEYWFNINGKKRGVGVDIGVKVYRQFPVKEVESKNQLPLINAVDKILFIKQENPKADTSILEKEIDQMVYKLYGLTKKEIEIVENATK